MKKTKRLISLVLVATFMLTLLAGCFSNESDADAGPQVLRILGGWGEDNYIRQQWTDHFEIANPNIEIDFTPLYEPHNPNQGEEVEQEDPRERIKRLLTEGTPPDVIMLDSDISMLSYLVDEGLVQPLDTFMDNSDFDVNSLVPAIREGIRAAGDGTSLYALAPMFQSTALFYNKDLFQQYNVPFPTDNMTWPQIIDLAKQFPLGDSEDQVYGLWSNYGDASIYEFITSYAAPLGLSLIDDTGENVVVNTPDWEQALSEYTGMYIDGVMSRPPQSESGEWNDDMMNYYEAFYRGKAAMSISQSYELSNLSNRRMYDTEAEHFDWDVVTVPTHASAPGVGGGVSFNGLMAINRNSSNANLAWSFIEFNNSESMLKIRSRNDYSFVSVAEYNQNSTDGPANIEAFFALTPAPDTYQSMMRSNSERVWQVFNVADQEMRAVINGDKTVQEAIEEIQTKGQEALDSEEPLEPPTIGF
ncbi:ABC transporter substrate-binding protein [Bacillus horti]|uniref:Multiple sugar transport system substrate-binding protein n=1 Tax=Caldalkalibacillus horti TaxID=77523 RepID=A0ABT9W2A1_9BACI|nr:extracellular solute-binding protein [Bacillus horti]MDQ0167382.1 multiple sugar transport system substrate-binding protein [Bacillus horti]